MEHKIGTHITLEVVESNSPCDGCYFFDMIDSCKGILCNYRERTDHKNIIYKEVK